MAIKTAFQCTICFFLIKPPLIFACCCKSAKNVSLSFFQKDGLAAGMGRKYSICRLTEHLMRYAGSMVLTIFCPMVENNDEDDPFGFGFSRSP